MKYLVSFSRMIVGILFIISGLIKLNDPVGFSFKLEEYFSQGVLDLPSLMPYALAISIFVVIIEVVLGVLLLLGFKKKFTLWSLLLMIVFFTFLTFYSAYFNKVTDCGCFGDAIKLTPWESFTKDILLLVFILVLFVGQKYIKPVLTASIRKIIVFSSVVLSVFYAYYVLNHLPQLDFRPYKIGANIEEGMTVPANAPKAIFEYAWKFDVGGEEKVIVTNGDYPTIDGEFIDVETTEVQKGYEPPIHDFTIEQDGEDLTSALLREPKLVMVVAYDLRKTNAEAFEGIKKMSDEALRKHYKVIGVSASDSEYSRKFAAQYDLNFEFYFTDETALKTIVRSNPGVLLLSEGTILNKVHYNDTEDLNLVNDKSQVQHLELKKSLDSVNVLGQKYRPNYTEDTRKFQMKIDSSSSDYVAKVIEKYGYPGLRLLGKASSAAAWHVIQHSNTISQYIALLKNTAEYKEIGYHYYAKVPERLLFNNNNPQLFNTRGISYFIGTADQTAGIWPVKYPDAINILRKQAGFGTIMEENAKNRFVEDFEYKEISISEVQTLIKK